jgi:cyclase
MLFPRIIPCLLVKNKGLVKTVKFGNPKYIGDPINAVKIFNEKEVDELIVLDIDATSENRGPDYRMIENLAAECRMPLCYGGGITTLKEIQKVISLGVEKVSLSYAGITNPELIGEASAVVGSQSIVVVLDVKKINNRYEIFTHNGKNRVMQDVFELALKMTELGAGEIVINSIDNDGMMQGYDFDIIQKLQNLIHVPITALGGAGSLSDVVKLFERFGQIGAGAGSLFVFKGTYKAVLINYPNRMEKKSIFSSNNNLNDNV